MKLKKKIVVFKPDVPFEKASDEELAKYSRLERRWAHQHIYATGLKLQNPSDRRVIQFLDEYYGKLKQQIKARRKAQIKQAKKAMNKAKVFILLSIILWPFFWMKKKLRKIWQNKG